MASIQVKRLILQTWLSNPATRSQFPAQMLAELQTQFIEPHGGFLIAMESGDCPSIIGTAGFRRVSEDTCEIRRLVVAPAFQRRGIGKELLEGLARVARAAGYQRMVARFPSSVPDLAGFS